MDALQLLERATVAVLAVSRRKASVVGFLAVLLYAATASGAPMP